MKDEELKIYELPEDFGKPLTEEDVRAIVSDSLVNFKDTARVQKGYWQSDGFKAGSTGWRIDALGNLEANSGNFRGTITATTGTIGGWSISSAAIYKDGASDATSSGMAPADYPFYAGKKYADRATAPYRITPAGELVATSATITGAITAGAGSVIGGSYITTATITGDKLTNATITATQIANATITATQIANATITTTQISGTAAITGTQIASATIAAGNIANATITTTQISGTAGITGGQIANATITTTQISATAGIVGGQIASATVTGGNIAATTITGGNITNLTITAAQIANLTISSGKVNTALMSYNHNLVFSASSATVVAWATGTLTTSDGTSYTISAGNTGTMSAKTFVYLDTAVSITVLQVTTTLGTAVGDGKMLVAIAQNNTTEAIFQVFNGIGGLNLAGSSIVTGSITANEIAASTITVNEIAANTITAAKMNVSDLSAISANIGSITAGSITVTTGSNTVSLTPASATAFASGPTGAPTVTITQAGVLTATGAVINGYVLTTKGTFGGSGSDGALAITSGTTTIDCGGASVVVKNYTSISITSTGKLAFSNPHANGTTVILKSQGNITITSGATCIDCSGLGATGGTGGASNNGYGTNGTKGFTLYDSDSSNGKAVGGVFDGGTTVANADFFSTSSSIVSLFKALHVVPGSGGGGGQGGATGGGTAGGVGGAGGRGGGGLLIECGGAWNFTTALGISVAGANGSNGGAATGNSSGGGGGGGGAAGLCVVLYNTLTGNTGTINNAGGVGGTGGVGNGASGGGTGGGGAGSCFGAGSAGASMNNSSGNVSVAGAGSGGAGNGGATPPTGGTTTSNGNFVAINNYFA